MILAIGQREVEERSVSLRRLGDSRSEVLALEEALQRLEKEALPPDLC